MTAHASAAVLAELCVPSYDGNLPEYLDELRRETYPTASIVRYRFPAGGGMPPVDLAWYDGGLLPPKPEGRKRTYGGNGAFIIGEEAGIHHGSHGAGGCRIFPEEKMQAYLKSDRRAPETLKRVPKGKHGHRQDWIRSCKDGKPASASFDYGGPLTELVLIGIVALRMPGKKLVWNGEKMEFDKKEATALVKPEFREGWQL